MAGTKRSSTTDLNHDNWDQELEKEEQGMMQVAAEKDLQTRKIIHARRKLPPREGSTSSPFQGLNLFGAKTGTPTFSFGMATTPSNVSGLFSNLSNNTPSPITSRPLEDGEPSAKRGRPSTSDDNQIVIEKTLTPIKEVCGSEEKEPEEKEQEEKVPPTPEHQNIQTSSISQSVSPFNLNTHLSATSTSKPDEKDAEENGESINGSSSKDELDGKQSQIETSIDLPSNECSSSSGDSVVEEDPDQVEMPPDDDDW